MKSVQNCTNNFFYPKYYLIKCLLRSLTRDRYMDARDGRKFLLKTRRNSRNTNEAEIYLKNLFITGKTLRSDAHIFFFFHSQTSNVTQATKLKLLFHECNNLFDSSTVQHPRVCRTNKQFLFLFLFLLSLKR